MASAASVSEVPTGDGTTASPASEVAAEATREQTPEELKRNKQAEKMMGTITGTVFPSHKPRDMAYGLKSGLFNIGAGVAAGATAIVTMPMIGAKQGGAAGFAQGLGAGLAMGVALPVTGVFNGLRQIGRGMLNTAESVDAQFKGKVWDREKECWVEYVPYNLKAEAAKVLSQGAGSEGGGGGGEGGGAGQGASREDKKVKDMHYYELLSVNSGATGGEIKKAYYKEARRCHPDRNPNDTEAHAKFQALGEAYRVLSSDQLRGYYDKHGREEQGKGGMGDSEMQMDMAKLFFAVMFGGDKFEPYIGQLGLSAFMDALTGEMANAQGAGGGGGPGPSLDLDEMKLVQSKREVTCALALAQRLEPCVAAASHALAASAAAASAPSAAASPPPPPAAATAAAAAAAAAGDEVGVDDGASSADSATSSSSSSSPSVAAEEALAMSKASEAEFELMVESEVAAMSKATFGEPLLHAIGSCYVAAADKYLGYSEGFLGLEGWAASMKQKTRENLAYMDVASRGIQSLRKVQHMSEIAEKDKSRLLEDPEPPTPEALEAKLASYNTLSVKELKQLCKERHNSFPAPSPAGLPPASADDAKVGLDTSACVEKSEMVGKLVENDSALFAFQLACHMEWKEGGCEGPPPVRPKAARRESTAAKDATKKKVKKEGKKDGAEQEEAAKDDDEEEKGEEKEEGAGGDGFLGGMDEGMSAEAALEMKQTMETSLPVFLETMVSASLLDVEVTLRAVCKKVLNDHGIDERGRAARARGMRKLGKAMEKAVGANKAARGEVEAKHVLEGTMMRTMAKAQGQEVDDDDMDLFVERKAEEEEASAAASAASAAAADESGDGEEEEEESAAVAAAEEAAEKAEVAAAVAAVAAAQVAEKTAADAAKASADDLD